MPVAVSDVRMQLKDIAAGLWDVIKASFFFLKKMGSSWREQGEEIKHKPSSQTKAEFIKTHSLEQSMTARSVSSSHYLLILYYVCVLFQYCKKKTVKENGRKSMSMIMKTETGVLWVGIDWNDKRSWKCSNYVLESRMMTPRGVTEQHPCDHQPLQQ